MSGIEEAKRRIKEIISHFKECRRRRGLSSCEGCEDWHEGELITCPLREEGREAWDLLFTTDVLFEDLRWLEEGGA